MRKVKNMTNEKQQQSHLLTRETLEQVLRVREEIMEHTNGRVFEDSVELIRQMREERTRQLMGEAEEIQWRCLDGSPSGFLPAGV
jgi:hypothetical protein